MPFKKLLMAMGFVLYVQIFMFEPMCIASSVNIEPPIMSYFMT